jgi:hypothetical protein
MNFYSKEILKQGNIISFLFCSWVSSFQKTATQMATSHGTGMEKFYSLWKEVGMRWAINSDELF